MNLDKVTFRSMTPCSYHSRSVQHKSTKQMILSVNIKLVFIDCYESSGFMTVKFMSASNFKESNIHFLFY